MDRQRYVLNGRFGGQSDNGGGWREWGARQTQLRGLHKFDDLRSFKVSETLHRAVLNKDSSMLRTSTRISGHLDADNYSDTLRSLLSIDEAHNAIALRKFDMFKRKLTIKFEGTKLLYFGVLVEGLSNGQPNLIQNDIVIMKNACDQYKTFAIQGFRDDLVLLDNQSFNGNEEFLTQELDIYFASCGLIYNYYEKAFGKMGRIKWRIFEDGQPSFGRITISFTDCPNSMSSAANERLEKLNEPQRLAVVNILKNECHPKPYILFGPPGTGKTHTLVEAIAQIYARSKASVLFCANSNTCADQTMDKLRKINFIEPSDIVRLAARERTSGIFLRRIVVTTNVKSSSLMEEYEFDYVFIDEAGHAHEPESLLPICSLKSNGCLVMAGDPKQLGPVIQCEMAAEFGLKRSMFERIFRFDIYKRDRETDKYNEKFITKLLISYRCDERILAISNKLFYQNELKCPNATPESILKIMNLSSPLQFCNVTGSESKPQNSTSWRNSEEAERVVDLIVRLYKMGFEPNQIGVMSPYKLQSKLIAQKVKSKLDGLRFVLEERFQRIEKRLVKKKTGPENAVEKLEFDLDKLKLGETKEISPVEMKGDNEPKDGYEIVGKVVKRDDDWLCKIDSVDSFQGNEREIIIISTVRTPSSGRKSFIDEPRRFNVALSRAKWLVFVVGDKRVLENQPNWAEFLSCSSSETAKWQKQSTFEEPFRQWRPLFRED